MKFRNLLVVLVLCLLTTPLYAGKITSEIELTRSIIQTEKQAIIAKNMSFTEAEAQEFWPVYYDFQAALRKVGDRRVQLIMDYAKNYERLSDKQAQKILNDHFKIAKARIKTEKRYMKKFKRILPIKKVARYIQLENKMESVINVELAANIPLIR